MYNRHKYDKINFNMLNHSIFLQLFLMHLEAHFHVL